MCDAFYFNAPFEPTEQQLRPNIKPDPTIEALKLKFELKFEKRRNTESVVPRASITRI
jgi:hypothetical protein